MLRRKAAAKRTERKQKKKHKPHAENGAERKPPAALFNHNMVLNSKGGRWGMEDSQKMAQRVGGG